MRLTRAETMAATRAKLIDAGRRAFAVHGYSDTAMEDLVAEAGLTRGALYHHFGGKAGLLEAVIEQIDVEMTDRLSRVAAKAASPWDAFVAELIAYVAMAAEPEIQRIVLLDGPAVLGEPSQWATQMACVRNTKCQIESLMEQGVIRNAGLDAEALARMVSSAALGASMWVANADDPQQASNKVAASLPALLKGLLASSEPAAESLYSKAASGT